ncbi:MAG: hypothetical protein VX500_07235, partial [Planctomycetota bacterium]|nr:hypothetical protein [Planctomycetota bacterium]
MISSKTCPLNPSPLLYKSGLIEPKNAGKRTIPDQPFKPSSRPKPFQLNRRNWLAAASTTAVSAAAMRLSAKESTTREMELKGNIHHSVVAWCFAPMDVPTLARQAVQMGIESVELVPPEHW